MATSSCWCGQAELVFSVSRPRMQLECCCLDCRQKLEWASHMALAAAGAGGAADTDDKAQASGADHDIAGLSKLTSSTGTVPRLLYFDDVLSAVRGREHLCGYLLRASGCSRFCVATCCWSVLCVVHPAYEGNVAMVFKDGCRLSGVEDEPPAVARIHLDDREGEPDGLASLPPYAGGGGCIFGGSRSTDPRNNPADVAELRRAIVACFSTPRDAAPASTSTSTSTSAAALLFEDLNPPVVLNLREGQRRFSETNLHSQADVA